MLGTVGTPAILIGVLYDFIQLLLANSGIVPPAGHDHILPNPFEFTIHQSFSRPTLYSLDTVSVIKQPNKNNIYIYIYIYM
jgi:hypothetical protein